MQTLQSAPLMLLKLNVSFAEMIDIGSTPVGRRRIVPVSGGQFSGARLNGIVRPGGADWVLNRADGVMLVDVRLTLETDDNVLIYLGYQGSFRAAPEVMLRFARGERLADNEYQLRTVARFETGDVRYRWLTDMLVVGAGLQRAEGVEYHLFEIL